MNKKILASAIMAAVLSCPIFAITHTFTSADIGKLKVTMSDGSLQPGDTLLLQMVPIRILEKLFSQETVLPIVQLY